MTTVATAVTSGDLGAEFIAVGVTVAARRARTFDVRRFEERFGDLAGWRRASLRERLAAPLAVRSYVGWAVVATATAVDADYVTAVSTTWGARLAARHPCAHRVFQETAADLGFDPSETSKMWSALAKVSVIAGATPDVIAGECFTVACDQLVAAVSRINGTAPKTTTTPLFDLGAVLFHLGRVPRPTRRRSSASTRETQWDTLETAAPQLVATMRRYLAQLRVSLRASSVDQIDTTLRLLAGYLTQSHPGVTAVSDVRRAQIEGFKIFLRARPGRRDRPALTNTTVAMRVGHLRGFFDRIIEWDYPDVPARPPVFAGDIPIKDRALPRFLDDAASAKLLVAARNLADPFDRLVVEMLARTGMRKGELLGLTVDAVVQIGSAFWLRTPVGKLHNDRYIPLHPQLKLLLDDWLAGRPDWLRSDLLFTDRGRPIPQTRIDRAVTRAATAAGIGHVHPHQLRHTLATQAINRGMSLEAIAALLGHKSLSMTLVYARIADRTVAQEYFSVTEKVEALYNQARQLPADAEGAEMRKLRAEMHRRMLGNGYCARPVELDCHFESICESCSFFVTTIEFRPTLRRQRDDAADKGQVGRQKIFEGLLDRLDNTAS
jgi:integrase